MTPKTSHVAAVKTAGRAHAHPAVALLLGTTLALLAGCSSKPSAVQHINEPQVGGDQAGDVAIAVDPVKHDLLMTWVAGDSSGYRIWFSRSANEGASWSTPVAVTPEGEPLRMHPESSPLLVCDESGRIGVAYSTSVEVEGRRFPASDLRFVKSTDGGLNWSTPATVNDDTASGPGSHTFFGIAQGVTGALFMSWLDSRPGADSIRSDEAEGHDASIHLARSEDFGATWGPNVSQWSRVCPCCRSSIVVDPLGVLYVTFRKHYPGQIRDVVVARPDGPPVRLHEDNWVQGGCPHSGPPMVISRDGTLRMAWFTGAEGHAGVYFRQSTPEMMDSTAAPLPVLVSEKLPTVHVHLAEAGMSGTLVACDADSTGARQVTLARIKASGNQVSERFVVPDSKGASYPRVAMAPGGKIAYVAWTQKSDDRSQVHLAKWDVGR